MAIANMQPGQVATGREIKNQAGIDPDRQLLLVRGDGTRIVPDDEAVQLQPGDQFEDVPNWHYGYLRPSLSHGYLGR